MKLITAGSLHKVQHVLSLFRRSCFVLWHCAEHFTPYKDATRRETPTSDTIIH